MRIIKRRVVANASVIHFIILIIIICNFLTVLFPVKMTTFLNILHTLYPTNLTLHFYLKFEKLLYIYKFYKEVVNMVNLKTKTGINVCGSKCF